MRRVDIWRLVDVALGLGVLVIALVWLGTEVSVWHYSSASA
jgi:hypothetical protein